MSYEQGTITETYIQPSTAFGATTETQAYVGPKGKTGYVRDIDVDITADMVGTTTVPEILVGSASGLSEYSRFRLGTTAVAGYTVAQTPVRRAKQVSNGKVFMDDFAEHVKLSRTTPDGTRALISNNAFVDTPASVLLTRIPADTVFIISRKAGVGGVPAGTARSRVIIDWI